jgi:hypothetical protein
VVIAVGGRATRVAGAGPRRALRAILLTAALAALAWLLTSLLGTGTAAADAQPEPGQPAGLLGLVDGLTGTVDGVLGSVTGGVDALSGSVADTVTPVIEPPPPPQPPVVTEPEPAPAPKPETEPPPEPAVSHTAEPDTAPTPTPTPTPEPEPTPSVAPAPRTAPAAATVAAVTPRRTAARAVAEAHPVTADRPQQPPTDQVQRSDDERPPVRIPPAPAAPAVPTGAVSAAHDHPGHGNQGTLAGQTGVEPPAEALSSHARSGEVGGRAPGLPALSPD